MSLDVFGRSFKKTKNQVRGLPGIGFKVTSDGHFDIEHKKICNLSEASDEGDATNYSLVKKLINIEVNEIYKVLDSLRSDTQANNIKITKLEDSVIKYLSNLKAGIKRNVEWLSLNKEIFTDFEKRIIALERT